MVKVGRETGIFYDFQAARRSTSGHPNSVWMGFSATQVQAGVHTDYLTSPDFKQGTKIMKKRKRKQRGARTPARTQGRKRPRCWRRQREPRR